jgi:hypothetical protein
MSRYVTFTSAGFIPTNLAHFDNTLLPTCFSVSAHSGGSDVDVFFSFFFPSESSGATNMWRGMSAW